MTEHEAIERIVLAQEAQTLALECINRNLAQIKDLLISRGFDENHIHGQPLSG